MALIPEEDRMRKTTIAPAATDGTMPVGTTGAKTGLAPQGEGFTPLPPVSQSTSIPAPLTPGVSSDDLKG